MARILELTLNGRQRLDAIPDNRLLLDYLREAVGLTGTKTGCDGGECGACTVLIDDRPALSCLTLAATAAGKRVDTVESLAHGVEIRNVFRDDVREPSLPREKALANAPKRNDEGFLVPAVLD